MRTTDLGTDAGAAPGTDGGTDPGAAGASAGRSAGKRSFDAIYDRPDPTAYFSTLRPLRYRAPHHAQPVFRAAARALARIRGRRPVEMLDLCTGYGLNGALVNHRLQLRDLYRLYRTGGGGEEGRPEGRAKDAAWFARHRLPSPPARVTGTDVAGNALAYARGAGLLDDALRVDLESTPPSPDQARRLARADMITVTGGFSYIGARTMMRLLSLFPADRMPWILAFPLRHTDFSDCVATFERFGLEVEQWDRWAFPHRDFADAGERAAVAAAHDPEADAIDRPISERHLEATLFAARPEADVARCALAELVRPDAGAAGRPRAAGEVGEFR